MNSLNAPTDNLYKFIAIFGLILFIFSIAFFSIKINDTQLKVSKNQALSETLGLYEKFIGISDPSFLLAKYGDNPDKLDDKLIFFFEKFEKNAIAVKENSVLVDQLDEYLYATIASMVVSILLMTLGFGLWYFKLQQYQDVLIKKEASS